MSGDYTVYVDPASEPEPEPEPVPDPLELGMAYHLGSGLPKDNLEAFRLFTEAACRGVTAAQLMLVQYHGEGIISPVNLCEAYTWALVARGKDYSALDGQRIAALEARLSTDEKIAAQKEAGKRFRILRSRNLCPDDLAVFAAPAKKKGSSSRAAKSAAARLDKLREWGVEQAKDLTLSYFLDTDKITFQHGKNKVTLKSADAFPERCVALIKIHYAHLHGEQDLDWNGGNVGAEAGSNRRNHSIVDDFNHEFRKLFGLDTRHKAFKWIGKGRYRTLKALINVEIR